MPRTQLYFTSNNYLKNSTHCADFCQVIREVQNTRINLARKSSSQTASSGCTVSFSQQAI